MSISTETAPLKFELRDYQKQAVGFLRERRRAALFLTMGLGKTAISLSALEPDMLPVLVTAPKRVAETVWDAEAAIWRPDLSVRLATGGPKQREEALSDPTADIVVIGRDVLADAVPHASRFRTVILDELSGFKNRSTRRWKAARKLTLNAPYVWGLTGTPSPNGLLDLWAQLYLLDRGERLETGITRFRNRYFDPGKQLRSGVVTEWILKDGAEKRIHEQIEDICLSMGTEGRVELPPVTYSTIKVPLPPKAKRVYKAMKDTLVADMNDLGLGSTIHSAANAAVLSSKLSQISAGFLYDDEEEGSAPGTHQILHSEKLSALGEILEGTGSPVLVFYRYIVEKDQILAKFPEAKTIESAATIREWNTGSIPILVAHPASAGHGLNLQHGGSTVVWTSPTWSLEEYEQANKRVARSGQKFPVVIHHLLGEGTVDTAVLERISEKKTVQTALLDHLMSPL